MCWEKWMDGRWVGYYWDGWTQFLWTLSTHTEGLFSPLPGYCINCFVWVTAELWMNTISSRSCHSRPGLSRSRCEAFWCFGVSALIRYHLQIAAMFVLQRRGIATMVGDQKGKAFQRHWSKTCQSFKTKYLIITTDACMKKMSLQNWCLRVCDVWTQKKKEKRRRIAVAALRDCLRSWLGW